MLLFQREFHAGLVDGSITLTFRLWDKPHVKPGGLYRCHPIGVLRVDAVDRVRLDAVSEIDAKQAGFASRAALVDLLAKHAKEPLADATEVWRVRLGWAGDGDRVEGAMDDRLSRDDVAAIAEKLAAMDARAPDGPWTKKTLALVAKHPRTAASQLAAKLGRETAPFKADIVKLKKLGLTQSFEVGYELSPRGRAFLEATAGKRAKAGR